jgi:MFS family permease
MPPKPGNSRIMKREFLDPTRAVIFIQFLNSFIGGVLTVTLPLLMIERNIDVVTIGLIFAAMPLIFQLTRMLLAIVSDFLGRKLFFISNGLLNVISSSIYYLAQTPLEFLFGKVVEGTKSASLWAVNRATLLEKNREKRRALVHLRTAAYVSLALGSLLAGFLIVWILYEKTLMLCIFIGAMVVPLSLLLVREKKKKFSVRKALRYLDFRRKEKIFKIFLLLFLLMGLSFGFRSGYVFPLFLSENGFDTEAIGVLLGLQTLLAGFFLYFFTRKIRIDKLILLSGLSYSALFILLSFSSYESAAFLVVAFGAVDGLLGGGVEGILSKITREESYGTDIGLLMMGLHFGTTISLAISGLLISLLGFAAPFLLSASILVAFYITAYSILRG